MKLFLKIVILKKKKKKETNWRKEGRKKSSKPKSPTKIQFSISAFAVLQRKKNQKLGERADQFSRSFSPLICSLSVALVRSSCFLDWSKGSAVIRGLKNKNNNNNNGFLFVSWKSSVCFSFYPLRLANVCMHS